MMFVYGRMTIVQGALPIGVFDSGVGGLTVAKAIREHLPHESILYLGDTAHCPYGGKSPGEVLSFSMQVCDFLVEHGIKLLVVACNTATAVALPTLRARYSVPVIGVIEPGASGATRGMLHQRIGVIGTQVTIESGAYERTVLSFRPDAKVFSLACPRFVPLVERGETSGPMVTQLVEESLAPLRDKKLDALILGCTHYPLLQDVIQDVVGPSVKLISSAERTAVEVARLLKAHQGRSTSEDSPSAVFYTTGDGTRMRAFLSGWLHINDEADIRRVRLRDQDAVSSQFRI